MKKLIFKIIMYMVAVFACNCFVSFLIIGLGSLLFRYNLQGWAVIVGGCVISFAELFYLIAVLGKDGHDENDWYD